MAKRTVPKRRKSRTQAHSRYAAYQKKAQVRLENSVSLVKCEDCGAMKRAHHVCGECGMYKGRLVLKVKNNDDKITTIKA